MLVPWKYGGGYETTKSWCDKKILKNIHSKLSCDKDRERNVAG